MPPSRGIHDRGGVSTDRRRVRGDRDGSGLPITRGDGNGGLR